MTETRMRAAQEIHCGRHWNSQRATFRVDILEVALGCSCKLHVFSCFEGKGNELHIDLPKWAKLFSKGASGSALPSKVPVCRLCSACWPGGKMSCCPPLLQAPRQKLKFPVGVSLDISCLWNWNPLRTKQSLFGKEHKLSVCF